MSSSPLPTPSPSSTPPPPPTDGSSSPPPGTAYYPPPSSSSTSPPTTPPTQSSPPPSSSSSPPPTPPTESSPPPSSSSPPPPTPPSESSPPPSSSSSPPPPPPSESSPPPSSSSSPPPPPTSESSQPPSSSSSPPPPPPSESSPPPSSSSSPPPASLSSPPPPVSSSSPQPAPESSSPPITPSSSLPLPSPSSSPPPPPPSSSPPPPPPTSHSSPSPSSSSGDSASSSSTSTGVIVGAAVGGVVAVLLLVGLFFFCLRRKRRGAGNYQGGFPGGAPLPTPMAARKDDYYNGGQPQAWPHMNAPPPPEHAIKIPPISPPSSQGPPPPVHSSSTAGGYGWNHQYRSGGSDAPSSSPGMALGFTKSTFTYAELVLATEGFSNANLLGQGGFGYVHRGILPNGKEVAVKQLKSGSGQGDREFQAEVEIITRVHHRHLVSLVGYCITGDNRLLVYEFVPNNTLEFHLHGKGRQTMEWSMRMKIALGAAKGLAYLHEDCSPKIIHRDIKAANILLDYKFEAKVADFGLAKLNVDNNTHVSTRVMGTFGYLAPEYAASGKLSEKSDVFSFGVMLLELITGRRPVDSTNSLMDDSLVDWARPLLTRALEDGNLDALADPRLDKNYSNEEMVRMAACAAACIRHSARKRPRMSQVVHALEGNSSLDDLNDGLTPGHSSAFGSYGSSDYDTRQYNEDMKKFRKLALTSEEYTSSEYGTTSGYGKDPSASNSEAFTREGDTGEMKDSRGF